MNTIALILVIISTFTHAYWNYILKRTNGGTTFVWLFTAATTILYIPFTIYIFRFSEYSPRLSHTLVFFMSIVFHVLYFIFLDKAYSLGDLSIVYPLARGIAPVFTIIIAMSLFKERLSTLHFISILFIILGSYLLSEVSFSKGSKNKASIVYALLCGFIVSLYTVTDKYAVGTLLLPPMVLDWFNNIGRCILLAPYALKNYNETLHNFRNNFKEVLIVAVLSPLSYLLVLYAMTLSPISLIAPLRQISILLSALLGFNLLYEERNISKIIGMSITFLGLFILCYS